MSSIFWRSCLHVPNKCLAAIRIVIFTCLVLSVVSCGGGDGNSSSGEGNDPVVTSVTVLSVSPTHKSALVDVDSSIQLVFDKEIDVEAIRAAFSISGNIAGIWDYDGATRTATFTPNAPLDFLTTYSVSLSSDSASGLLQFESAFITQNEVRAQAAAQVRVALLDLTERNGESDSSTTALIQALEIMGLPFDVIEQPADAVTYPMIFSSSYIAASTLDDEERQTLITYVQNGGVLLATGLSDAGLFELFGVLDQNRINTRQLLNWGVEGGDESLKYMDDPYEIEVSLGGGSHNSYIYSRSYSLGNGLALGNYEDDEVAVVTNIYGDGVTYLMGLSYSDIILRNQMNLDYSADRVGINNYEPTTDSFLLFLRAIYEKEVPHALWKHTSPSDSVAALIMTHDVDSQSSVDWMPQFIEMENSYGMSGTFNVNTRYIDDANDSDYYTMNIDIYRDALAQGHSIGSHSVGHFPDFDDENRFPIGSPGNSMADYQPYYDGESTTGGTVYGELEVSKNLLDTDLGMSVTTFRTGHLLWNKHQVQVMEALGYRYDSSHSSASVLTNFPYRLLYETNVSSDRSSIYEFPLAITDSALGYEGEATGVDVWLGMLAKNMANSAPTVLMVHPNRESKLDDLEQFISQLPKGVVFRNMDSFGQYWQARDGFDYEADLEDNVLTLRLKPGVSNSLHEDLSLIVRQGVNLAAVRLFSSDGSELAFVASSYSQNNEDLVLHHLGE